MRSLDVAQDDFYKDGILTTPLRYAQDDIVYGRNDNVDQDDIIDQDDIYVCSKWRYYFRMTKT